MRRPSNRTAAFGLIVSLSLVGGAITTVGPARAARGDARIFTGAATTLDPAAQGDVTSASISAQLFETLTTFDAELHLQPALAESWRVEEAGTRVVFHLRPGLTFSDGTSLRASDVVRSWLRLIDPAAPSPLASLMFAVEGASAFMDGSGDASGVGLVADDAAGDVTVTMARPAADFPDVIAGASFGVVPPTADEPGAFVPSLDFVASGGYEAVGETGTSLTLRANDRYWAGRPAIGTLDLVTDLGGRSEVEVFEDGDLDYAPISSFDATWIAYDPRLGPQLREVPTMAVEYYGFDTTRAPFDDVRVRRAFGMGVDWRRISRLGSYEGEDVVANSMVPTGVPNRSDRDFLPAYDPAAARALLGEAGYPGGAGFPTVTMQTSGGTFDAAIVDEVRRALGVELATETMDFEAYFDRLEEDPPQIWSLSWIADYPGRNDFLGVLLGSDSTNDYGGWTSDGVRFGHRGRHGRWRPHGRGRGLRPGRGRRPAGRARRAGGLWHGLGVVAVGPAGRRAGRARDHADGWPGVGGLMRRASIALLAGALLAMVLAVPVAAATFVEFGTPTASGTFGEDIVFSQPATAVRAVERVELLVTYADGLGPEVIPVSGAAAAGSLDLRYTLSVSDDGHILPNTPIRANWRVVAAGEGGGGDTDEVAVGPTASLIYADTRFDWQTASGDIVRVHWYEGGDAFGQRALAIGEEGVESAATLLGVEEDEPVDFFIYADQAAFYDALGPGTRENVGGQANAEIRTLFALIAPSEIDDAWVDIVIPHELTHLVFDTAVDNPYHFPPRWLNEGLATYESEGYSAGDRSAVEAATREDALIPLPGLSGQFPTSGEGFRLAYAESASAIDYFIRTHGQDALVALIGSYADGRTDDEAFEAAIGQDVETFNAAWLTDLGATTPVRYGPQPAPLGPLPPGWVGAPRAPVSAADDGLVGIVVGGAAILGIGVVALAWYASRRRQDAAA